MPTGCSISQFVTLNPSPSITGPSNICSGLPDTLSDAAIPGGTWVSSNTSVATVGSASGIILGSAVGTTTITYTAPNTGCQATSNITVSPPPALITGTTNVCVGLSTTLGETGGGGWYSSNPSTASIGFGSGTVTGLTAGTVTISYSLGTTCVSTTLFTVNPLPSMITGSVVVCPATTSPLSDTLTGGTWTSTTTSVATIGSSLGILTG